MLSYARSTAILLIAGVEEPITVVVVTAFSYSTFSQLQVGQTPGFHLLPFIATALWSTSIRCCTGLVLSFCSAPIHPGNPGLRKGTLQQY
jgi:hypothetical protein